MGRLSASLGFQWQADFGSMNYLLQAVRLLSQKLVLGKKMLQRLFQCCLVFKQLLNGLINLLLRLNWIYGQSF